MAENDLDQKKQDLIQMLERDGLNYEKRRKRNRNWANSLLVLTILVAFVALGGGIAAGEMKNGIIPAIAGGSIVLLRLIDRSFPWSERADFFRILAFECKNLVVALKLKKVDLERFNIVVEKYNQMNKRAAMKVPRGQGMQVVKELYEDMDRRGFIEVPQELLAK